MSLNMEMYRKALEITAECMHKLTGGDGDVTQDRNETRRADNQSPHGACMILTASFGGNCNVSNPNDIEDMQGVVQFTGRAPSGAAVCVSTYMCHEILSELVKQGMIPDLDTAYNLLVKTYSVFKGIDKMEMPSDVRPQ